MKRILVLVGALALVAAGVFAATTATHPINLIVDPVASIELNNIGNIDLSVTAPAAAGGPPTGDSDNTKFLRYTVVASAAGGKITVEWDGDMAAPSGTQLVVTPTVDGGYGSGAAWTFLDADAAAHDFITAIPSCYTSNGGADLHAVELLYELNVTAPGSLDTSDDTAVTVTYTISAS